MSNCVGVVFDSDGRELVGILHEAAADANRGVLIVTGGPQYRAGSHRQFLLIARRLAAAGFPVLRFDYRGMGDSEGALTDFKSCEADIIAAIKELKTRSSVREVVLWGLCDAASAILMHAARNKPEAGLVLINPWVRSEAGLARAYLRHYYWQRLFSLDLVRRLLTGRLDFGKAFRGVAANIRTAFGERATDTGGKGDADTAAGSGENDYREMMRLGLHRFSGPVLLILCGNDLTAREFVDFTRQDRRWRKLLERRSVTTQDLDGADHTFSKRVFRDTVTDWTTEWLRSW